MSISSYLIVIHHANRSLPSWQLLLDRIPVCVYNVAVYSVREAARKLGLDTSQVRRLLAKGEIKGVKLARDWVVLDLSYKRKRKPRKK